MRRFVTGDEYNKTYPGAFSATDIEAVMVLPGGELFRLGSLAAISISTHRDAFPVTSMGSIKPRGFTRGHVTVGGTLLFHTLDRAALGTVGGATNRVTSITQQTEATPARADQLPLFDVYLTYVNEIGMLSVERIFGLVLLDFGKTVSLENLVPMEQYSYMALDYAPLQSVLTSAPQSLKIEPTASQKRSPKVYSSGEPTFQSPWNMDNLQPETISQKVLRYERYLATESEGT
jgi:hypothetical protein